MPASFEPRLFLVDRTRFGRPGAAWLSAPGRSDRVKVAAAYWQHKMVLALREHRRIGERFNKQELEELALLLNRRPDYVRRLLNGQVLIQLTDVVGWPLDLDDITVLPAIESVADLLPR